MKNEEKFKRGFLSGAVKSLMSGFLDEEIETVHLRLMPYLLSCLMNNGVMSSDKINDKELNILKKWDEKGYIAFERKKGDVGFYEVKIKSLDFYKFMCDVIWLGYIQKDITV